MARTIIGELILRLKDEMSGKAKGTASSVSKSLDQIERSAKRLSNAQWGVGFQRQLDKLKTSSRELNMVQSSWSRLQDDMQKRNLSKAMRGNELSGWKTAVLANLASVRAGSKATTAEINRLKRAVGTGMKPLMVAAGGYTGAYVVGVGARAAINSASMEQRERAKQHYAGLPTGEQATIEKMSQELSAKYRTSQATAMEIMREARLAMPSADKAFGVAEEMIQAYKMLSVTIGSDQAITGLRAFNKAMDNINVTEDSNLYVQYLDNFIKAQQITGKDMDPEAYAQAIKYARTSGKVFSPDFMQKIMPFLIAESGGSDTGTQLRAFFDQMVGGQAFKKQKDEQSRLGLRDKNGIVDAEGFANNPLDWVYKHVLPALEKDKVDLNSDVEIAQAVAKFSSNRLARDFIQRALTQRSVYMRLSEIMGGAIGLDGANDVDMRDPFSAFQGFKDAFANLSAALIPIESISSGLVSFANAINTFANAFRNSEDWAKYTVGGVAAGGAGLAAYGIGKSVYALLAAGPSLQTAAVMLQQAAVAQGGAGVVEKSGKGKGLLGLAGGLISNIAANPAVIGTLGYGVAQYGLYNAFPPDQVRGRPGQYGQAMYPERTKGGVSDVRPMPGMQGDALGKMVQDAEVAGKQMQTALSPTGSPQVDVSAINNALALARQLASLLGAMPAMAAQAAASTEAALRQAHTDYGVAP